MRRFLQLLAVPAVAVAIIANALEPSPAQAQPAASLTGAWIGTFENSRGTKGSLNLEITKDEQGQLAGFWDDVLPIEKGIRKRKKFSWSSHYKEKSFEVAGTVAAGGRLEFKYTAKDAQGKVLFTGTARFQRRVEEKGPFLVLDAGGHTEPLRNVRFTKDGEKVISVAEDHTVRIWSLTSGETLQTYRLPLSAGQPDEWHGMDVSPDGKYLAISGNGLTPGRHWVFLISLSSHSIVRTFKGHAQVIMAVAFSPDGKWLATGGDEYDVRLWDVATGQMHKQLTGHKSWINALAFAPDGQRLASACEDGSIRLWSPTSGETLRELKGHNGEALGLAWSPDGKILASRGGKGGLRLWNANGPLRAMHKHRGDRGGLAFTPDSRRLLVGHTLLDTATGKRLAQCDSLKGASCAALSPDGRLAVTGGGLSQLIVWNTASGQTLLHLGGEGRVKAQVGWDPNGKSLAWKSPNEKDLSHSFQLDQLKLGPAAAVQYRRSVHQLGSLTLAKTQSLAVAVKQDGKEDRLLKLVADGAKTVNCFTFVGPQRVVVGTPYSLQLFDVPSGTRTRSFKVRGSLKDLAPAPNGRYFLSTSQDQSVRIWDVDREDPILSLFVAGNHWIAWTPEGYYAASPGGERLMGWQMNNGPEQFGTFYPAAQFRRSLYRPDVIRRLLDEGSLARALTAAERDKKEKSPLLDIGQVLPPKVSITTPAETGRIVKEPTLTVKATAQSMGKDPVTEMQLLLDGRPHEGEKNRTRSAASQLVGKVEAAWTVQLPPGSHRLAVLARTAKSSAMSDAIEITFQPAQQPDLKESLHILAIGIDSYPGDLRLQCAVRDATKLKEALEKNSAPLFRPGLRRVLTNMQATKQAILAELETLKRQMKHQDVAVIFYAGHGYKDDQGEFYLLPPTFNADRLAQTAVTGSELKKKLAELPGRVMLILDACHSGAVGARVKGSQPFTDDLTRELADDDCGVIVMCAAMGKEESLEDGEHGYFTRFLIGGLSGQADRYKGRVYFTGLDYYVERMVTEKTQDRQHPVTAKPSTIRSFALTQP